MKKTKWEIIDDVPKFPNGGATNPPIYVNDPKDPRIRMYNDSLNYYTTSKNKIGSNAVDPSNTPVYLRKDVNLNVLNNEAYNFLKGQPIDHSGRYDLNMNPNNNFPPPKIKQKILPIGGIGINKGNSMGGWYDIYKKPVQPYIFDSTTISKLIPDKSKGYSGVMNLISKKDGSVLNTDYINYKRQQEETIPFNKMELENLDPLQSMQRVPEPDPITSVPKDYVTIKTGSSYRNPETGAFEQKSFKIDKLTGKRILQNGGQTKSNWQIIE